MLLKEGRFGRQCHASLKCIDILDSAQEYLRVDSKCQNEVSRLLRSLLLCPLVHFEWTVEVLVGYHLMEPFLGISWSAAKTQSLTTSNSFSELFRSDDQSNWGSFLCNSWLTCPAYTSRWFFTGVQKDLDGFLSSPSKAIWALKIGKCSPNCHEKIGI